MQIRDFTPADYPGIVAVQNAIYLNTPAVVDDYVKADEERPAQCRFRRWVAEADGQIVGMAQYWQSLWNYDPRHFDLTVRVIPPYRGQGIGRELYDGMLADLAAYDPALLRSSSREDLPEGMRFLTRRGFTENHRYSESHLDVASFDPAPFAGLVDRVTGKGITLATLGELMATDPDYARRLYDLEWELLQDIPDAEDLTRMPFDEWCKQSLESDTLLPDGYFVARDGDAYVGLSAVWGDRASDMLLNGLTGVKRDYRRRGIATAMKLRAIDYARVNRNSIIKTDNEVNNIGMLTINRRLGFVKQPDIIAYEKMIQPA